MGMGIGTAFDFIGVWSFSLVFIENQVFTTPPSTALEHKALSVGKNVTVVEYGAAPAKAY